MVSIYIYQTLPKQFVTPLQSAFFPYSYLIIHRNIWSTVLIDVSDYITFLAINSFVPLSSHNLLCGLSLFLLDTLRNYLLLRKKCSFLFTTKIAFFSVVSEKVINEVKIWKFLVKFV